MKIDISIKLISVLICLIILKIRFLNATKSPDTATCSRSSLIVSFIRIFKISIFNRFVYNRTFTIKEPIPNAAE